MDAAALVDLMRCMVPHCEFVVTNVLTGVNHILRALSNYIAGIHLGAKNKGCGGAAKSTATILML